MNTPDNYDSVWLEVIKEENKRFEEWEKAKSDLKGLIKPKYFDFVETNDSYHSEGIVEIKEIEPCKPGYMNYPHCIEVNSTGMMIYIKCSTFIESIGKPLKHEGKKVDYWVWQTSGYLGDDYSGFLLLPLNNGKYWKVSYCC